jgi:serine/threonine-protein kinase
MTGIGSSLADAIRDRYALDRELGRGGMATVYLADDRKHGRKVAIKVLHPELSAVLGSDRFLAEIKLTASLQHPHILGLIDSGAANGHLYYVMPFVAGESLRQRLDREKQLPVAEALRLATEVADALDYAHQRGVIHRDIKPENILLQGGHALVADFGIALAVQEAGGSRMTQTGLSLGTPQYMSPEQASGERALTARSDIYALGAVTYELLTGDPPFTSNTVQGVLAKVMTEEPRRPSVLRKSVPPHVDAALLTALQKIPADRFSGSAEFARALAAPAVPGRPTRIAPQRPKLLAALGVLVLLALGGGYLVRQLHSREAVPEAPNDVRRLSLSLPDTAPLAIGTGRPALALVPDGSRLLYVARVHGENVVLIRDLISDSLGIIAGSIGATGPLVSPSGDVAGFVVGQDFVATPINGGRPRLVEALTPVTRGAAWLTDSTAAVATDPNGWIVKVPLREGTTLEHQLWLSSGPDKAPGGGYAWPELLPSGKALLYVITDGADPSTWRIAVRALSGGPERIVIEGGSNPRYAGSGHIVFVRQDALWAVPFDPERLEVRGRPVLVQQGVLTEADGLAHYTLSTDGTLVYAAGGGWQPSRRLVWVSANGTLDTLPIAAGMYENVALAPDGQRVALVRADGSNHDVWLGDLTRGTLLPLTHDPGEDGSPVWSPDGRKIALASEQSGGPPKLAIADLAGGGVRLAVDTGPRFSAPTAWSSDGRLYFVSSAVGMGRSATGGDIAVLDRSQERFWLQTTREERSAVPTPDGHWVAYVSDESGRDEVYLRSASGTGEPIPVSTGGGVEPRWGRSGRTLYFRQGDRVLAVDITRGTSASIHLSSPRKFVQLPSSFVTGAGFNGAAWDISPDERRVLGLEDRKFLSVSTLRVVLHWYAVLGRVAPPERSK